MNEPLVSVIIPTFNRINHLRRALQSVLNQTYDNIEIIVVDDCSDINLESLKEEFPSVRFFRNDENRGACYSRNRGLSVANGVFINFLDDDDELYPEKIDLQVKKFRNSENQNLGLVTAHAIDIRSGKEVLKENRVSGNIYRKLLYAYLLSGTETILFKTSYLVEIGGFDEELQSSQEYDVLIRFTEKFEVDYVDKVLSKENRSENQISLDFDKKIRGAKYLFKKHNHRYKSGGFLFWARMQLKLRVLLIRFYAGKWFGEKAYRVLGVR